jgi:predicted RNA-binding protein
MQSSTLRVEATCSSETLVDTEWTTRHYIPEVDTLHNHCCENHKSYTDLIILLPCGAN